VGGGGGGGGGGSLQGANQGGSSPSHFGFLKWKNYHHLFHMGFTNISFCSFSHAEKIIYHLTLQSQE